MKLRSKLLVAALMIMSPFAFIFAENAAPEENVEAFRYYKDVVSNARIPTVLEVPFDQEYFSVPVFAVYDRNTSSFEPYLLTVNSLKAKPRIEAVNSAGDPSPMNDGSYYSYTEFPLYGETGMALITLRFDKPIAASSLSFALDNYVALPQRVSINADVSGRDTIVLARTQPQSESIMFPKTESAVWRISFEYTQPLRISEIELNDLSPDEVASSGLRFLAQPGHSYRIYFDADRYVTSSKKEAGDLFSSEDVVVAYAPNVLSNPEYKPVDSDLDGVPNLSDNCVGLSNPDQEDGDMDGLGNACEDYDRDYIKNGEDNCMEIPNAAQEDTDQDGAGDACDSLDNRITERMPWLPWAGIGIAGAVLLGLFTMVLKYKPADPA